MRCHKCGKILPLPPLGMSKAPSKRAAARTERRGKMIVVRCPSCGAENRIS